MNAPTIALCLAHLGRSAEARENLVGFLGAHPLDANSAPVVLVQLLETAVLVGDRAATAQLASWLAGQAPRATAGGDPTCIARHLGSAMLLLGEGELAHASYQHALEVAGQVRCRPELALIHLQLAALCLQRAAQRAGAVRHLDYAIIELRDMNMQPALARATALQRQTAAPAYPTCQTPPEWSRVYATRTQRESLRGDAAGSCWCQ